MDQGRAEFIDFMHAAGVLVFGDFTTKSGRPTPYFVNTGRYTTGRQMEQLGRFYADAIVRAFPDGFDVLFGPAYKGIPLVVTTAIALARDHGIDVPLCFNRKEAKAHGEGGVLVGHPLQDGERVLIVEDVTTAGTSIRETVPILRAAARVRLSGLIVSVDRMEPGPQPDRTALQSVGEEFGMPTASIVDLDDVIERLQAASEGVAAAGPSLRPEDLERVVAHRQGCCIRRDQNDPPAAASR